MSPCLSAQSCPALPSSAEGVVRVGVVYLQSSDVCSRSSVLTLDPKYNKPEPEGTL